MRPSKKSAGALSLTITTDAECDNARNEAMRLIAREPEPGSANDARLTALSVAIATYEQATTPAIKKPRSKPKARAETRVESTPEPTIAAPMWSLPFDVETDESGNECARYRDEQDNILAMCCLFSNAINLSEIDEFIFSLADEKPVKNELIELRRDALQLMPRRGGTHFHEMTMFAIQKIVTIDERMRAIKRERQLLPLARHALNMKKGKKKGARGESGRVIADYIAQHHDATPEEVFDAFADYASTWGQRLAQFEFDKETGNVYERATDEISQS
jgi:hypothetical protein